MQSIIFFKLLGSPPEIEWKGSNIVDIILNSVHAPANSRTSVIKILKEIILQENETYIPNKNYQNCGRTLIINDLDPSVVPRLSIRHTYKYIIYV